MTTRQRPRGALEASVQRILWDADEPLSANGVRDRIGAPQPTQSAVLTVLTRLEHKGLISRITESPRKVRFAPVRSEADQLQREMLAILRQATDRRRVLSNFVAHLDPQERQHLNSAMVGRRAPLVRARRSA